MKLLSAMVLLVGGLTSAFAGGKAVLQPALDDNPLCFLDGVICFDLQERVRFEARENTFDFNNDVDALTDDSWLLNRFRLGVMIKPSPWLRIYAQGQDAREYHSDRPDFPGTLGAEGDDSFDLREGYVEWANYKEFPIGFKVGRQVLAFGDERLIGPVDWTNFSRTFDAARLTYKSENFSVDLFTSSVVVITRHEFNKSDLFNGNENDRQLIFSGVYFSTEALPFGTVDVYALLLNQKNGTAANLEAGLLPPAGALGQHSDFATFGARIKGDPKKLHGFEFDVEGAYQNGQVRDLALSAFAVHAGVGYNFDVPWKPRFYIEYNYASGDTDAADNNIETFQNLFPTNHKFYGIMDLFSWQNMHGPAASLRVTPLKSITAQLDYHAFFIATNEDVWYRANGLTSVRPLTPTARDSDKYEGSEADFIVTWSATRNLQIQGGYAHFWAGDYLAATGAADDADFGYVMATVHF